MTVGYAILRTDWETGTVTSSAALPAFGTAGPHRAIGYADPAIHDTPWRSRRLDVMLSGRPAGQR